MTIRISDVAARAEVSTATVSHVINNTRKVTEETKEKVWQAIHELGYSPNISARNLKTGRTRMIGLIIPDISNLFFAMVARQIENVLGKQDYNLIIMNSDENLTKEELITRVRKLNNMVLTMFLGNANPLEYQIAILNQFDLPFQIKYLYNESVDDKTVRAVTVTYGLEDKQSDLANKYTGKLKDSPKGKVYDLFSILSNNEENKDDN